MGGGYREEERQAEAVKFRYVGFETGLVNLVYRQQHRFAGAPQVVHHQGVPGLEAFPAIGYQDDDVGFGHRLLGLEPHLGPHFVFASHQTPGIHQENGAVRKFDAGIMTIPGDPGDIGDQCPGGAAETVEQSGLAHVGPADDGHQGQPLRGRRFPAFALRFSGTGKRHFFDSPGRGQIKNGQEARKDREQRRSAATGNGAYITLEKGK